MKTTIKNPQAALKLGWHDFSFSRGCVPLPNLAGQADAQTLGGIYEVPPFFCRQPADASSPALVTSVEDGAMWSLRSLGAI
jgi:hypothetical protein